MEMDNPRTEEQPSGEAKKEQEGKQTLSAYHPQTLFHRSSSTAHHLKASEVLQQNEVEFANIKEADDSEALHQELIKF